MLIGEGGNYDENDMPFLINYWIRFLGLIKKLVAHLSKQDVARQVAVCLGKMLTNLPSERQGVAEWWDYSWCRRSRSCVTNVPPAF